MMINDSAQSDVLSGDLEGSEDVQLAPVKGKDLRRKLPREYFVKKPGVFLCKYFFAFFLIVLGWSGVVYALTVPLSFWSVFVAIGGMLVNGLMYAHLVELQHECLHAHAFNSAFLNRLFGVLAGVFMFSSHSHYRYDHLRHHAFLGTERNDEHFDYRFNNIDSVRGFTIAFFDLNRYKRVLSIIVDIVLGKPIEGVDKEQVQRQIKNEYILYAVIFILSVIASIVFKTWLFALAWWIPTILVAEGMHFLIEMPEHYGLNTQSAPDVLENTRTIKTNSIVSWYVNGNDIHTAHHFHQGVPMCNVKKLNSLIESQLKVVEPSYRSFYSDVIRGRIQHHPDTSCMPR